MMDDDLKENNAKDKDGTDVNSIMREMMSRILEGALDQEMDEKLGYSKYDCRNRETDNSRNGHSRKTMHISSGDMEIGIPKERKGEFEPQIGSCCDVRSCIGLLEMQTRRTGTAGKGACPGVRRTKGFPLMKRPPGFRAAFRAPAGARSRVFDAISARFCAFVQPRA